MSPLLLGSNTIAHKEFVTVVGEEGVAVERWYEVVRSNLLKGQDDWIFWNKQAAEIDVLVIEVTSLYISLIKY